MDLVGADWCRLIYDEYSAFSLLTPPFPAVSISSLPFSPRLQTRPTPFFSIPFFRPTHPPLPPFTHAFQAPPTRPASAAAKSPPRPWKHAVPPASRPWSSLPLHTHFLCVCLPASLCPPPLPPLTSPPSLQLGSSLSELTLSLAFALTGQSPRAEPSSFIRSATLPLSFVSRLLSAASHPFICGAALRVSSPENISQLTEFALTCL